MARLAIRMPKMSMTMTEGEVSSWSVAVGDTIAEGDVIAEVMTDKVDMEVESTVAGVLVEIAVESGTVGVGEPIAWVEGEDAGGGFGDLLSEPAPEPAPPAPAPEPEPEPVSVPATPVPAGPLPAVPRARGLARESGIDLATVSGSGPDGLIRVEDVERAAAPPPPAPPPPPPSASPPDRRIAVRRAVARAMAPTALVPQFTVWREVRLDAADLVRRHLAGGLSWTTVLLRAYAAALREVPELLSRWEGDAPTAAGPPTIALAVATDRGLLVPVFTEPDLGPVADRDAEVRAVVKAAQAGRVSPEHMAPANGSLSNLGGLGVDRFQALLTPPQASVLSLGSITHRPVAVPGGVGVALTVQAGLTVDHRVADGAHGATLLDRLARRLDGGL